MGLTAGKGGMENNAIDSQRHAASSVRNEVYATASADGEWILQQEDFSGPFAEMLRLLMGDSSTSARIARRSSVAEITGKRMINRHPSEKKHCSEDLRRTRALRQSCHSQ